MGKMTDRQIYKYRNYTVSKTKNGYSCSIPGVRYVPAQKGWICGFKRGGFSKHAFFAVKKHTFDIAVEKAAELMLKWRDIYDLEGGLNTEDYKKVSALDVGTIGPMTRTKKTRTKEIKQISKSDLDLAVDEYFKNGGTVTKIELKLDCEKIPYDGGAVHDFLSE